MLESDQGIFIYDYDDYSLQVKKSYAAIIGASVLVISLTAVCLGTALGSFDLLGGNARLPKEIGLPIAGAAGALAFVSLCGLMYKLARHSMLGEQTRLIAHHSVDELARHRSYSFADATRPKSRARVIAPNASINSLSAASSRELGQSLHSTEYELSL